MGSRGNYGWEKRQRQLKKQKKKEGKAEKKRLAREAALDEVDGDAATDGDGEPVEAADGDQLGEGDPVDGDPVGGDLPDAEPGIDPGVP